jgi:membrane dipeptidase
MRTKQWILWTGFVLALSFVACDQPQQPQPAAVQAESEVEMNPRAVELAKRFLLIDTHIDVPYRLNDHPDDVSGSTATGDFDFPRAVQGGLDVPFMSIYVPAEYQETGGAKDFADKMIAMVEGIVAEHPDKFEMVASADEAAAVPGSGKLGFAMGIENGAAIEDDLANLKYFFDKGVRYITLTHGENNQICDSSYATEPTWQGLSPFGREFVVEMNKIGMLIDISHVSDAAFEQVLELTQAPVIASHSSCRYFTPGWERNMSDEMITALGRNGGVIQINFGSTFLREDTHNQRMAYWKAREIQMAENELEEDSEQMVAWDEAYWSDKTKLYADVTDVADHIDRVVELAGIDHVGIGSDFDGVGDSLPTGLKDVSQYPNLIAVLLERGYSEEDVEKICSGNLMRVWREVERIAAGG